MTWKELLALAAKQGLTEEDLVLEYYRPSTEEWEKTISP